MDANFEGFTEEQKDEYKRCARLVHGAFDTVEPISGGYRLNLDTSKNRVTTNDISSFVRLEQKACPFLTLKYQASRNNPLLIQLDMIESPEARGFLEDQLRSYGYL